MTPVNGKCKTCGAPAYQGLHTRLECTRRTCDESVGMRNLSEEWRQRVRGLRARLDELEDEEGPVVEQATKDVQRAIDCILGRTE